MRILWLCNTLLTDIADALGVKAEPYGGWVSGMLSALLESDVHLHITIVCPYGRNLKGTIRNLDYYTFTFGDNRISTENYFVEILEKVKPDIIQIFGSEYEHSLLLLRAADRTDNASRTVLHIQGMTSVCCKHMIGNLPWNVIYGFTLRDMVKRDNVWLAMQRMRRRGEVENEIFSKASRILGRTDWDYACSNLLTTKDKYHHVGELLREPFYTGKWSYKECKRHTIFFTQPMTQVKAFYQLLKAFAIVFKKYPDARIRTTGKPLKYGFPTTARQSYYQNYLAKTIKELNEQDKIDFLGTLSAEEIKRELLMANVFVMSSSIENSPNSLGEAMILGTPCIASDVGGIASMIRHNTDGYLYPFDEPYMLALYIEKLFESEEQCNFLSTNSIERAHLLFSKENNVRDLLSTYSTIIDTNMRRECLT